MITTGYECSLTARGSSCGAGTYSPEGVTVCTTCPVGTYTASSPYASCTICPAGMKCPDATAGR